jgi:hypothetical protein
MIAIRPLEIFDLRHYFRFDPDAFLHVLGGHHAFIFVPAFRSAPESTLTHPLRRPRKGSIVLLLKLDVTLMSLAIRSGLLL